MNDRVNNLAIGARVVNRARRVRDVLSKRLRRSPAFEKHPPTLAWRLAKFAIARSKDHAFLDRIWISSLFRLAPRRWRRWLALRMLSLSPHYWIYQWTNKYAPELSRRQIIEAEYERNAASRRELRDKLLARHLRPEMTVLDFGCGPGFLAKAVSPHVRRVLACDVSRGVIACARQLNHAENIEYLVNPLADLRLIPDASVDLTFSFAVFQHLLREQAAGFFREFARVLKLGGTGVCHVILKESGEPRVEDPSRGGWIRRQTNLRMVYYTPDEIREVASRAGLRDVTIRRVDSLAEMGDDIGSEQLLLFRR